MIFIIAILVVIFLLYFRNGGASSNFENVYAEIPMKNINRLSSEHFNGLYIIKEDPENNLPIWKITKEGSSYVWNAGFMFLPFARFHVDRREIESKFKNLINYETEFNNQSYLIEKLPHKLTIFHQYVLFKYNEYAMACVDYFQEEVRMVCKRRNKQSHWTIYMNEKKPSGISLNFNIQMYKKVQDDLWHQSYSCTEISPEVTTGILDWAINNRFTVNNVLDMSAGRGSRLIACIAHNSVHSYTGVDPSSLSHEWYETQSRYYCDLYNNQEIFRRYKNPDRFKVLKGGFVETELPFNSYDIMFSSPPYFDLEEYSNDKEQSTFKNKNVDKWLKNFMLPSMRKIIDHLRPGGLMCININLSRIYDDDWVTPMIAFKFGCEYLGCISSYKEGKEDVQPTWIWQKKHYESIINAPIHNILSYFNINVVHADNLEKALKYEKKKIKNTLTIAIIPRQKINYANYPIWEITDDNIKLIFNNTGKFLPLSAWHTKLETKSKGRLEYEVLDKKWRTNINLPNEYYKFNGKNVLLLVKSGNLYNIEYFTSRYTMICRSNGEQSPWELFWHNKTPQKNYEDLMDWFYFNRLLCVSASDSLHASFIDYIRKEGYPCTRVYSSDLGIFKITLSAFMYLGCDYLYRIDVNQNMANMTSSILRAYNHKIKKFKVSLEEPNEKFNLILYNLASYNLYKYSDDKNDEYNIYKRYDVWIKHVSDHINKCYDLLEDNGIICLYIYMNLHVDDVKNIFNIDRLKFLGGIGIYKNNLATVWIWTKSHIYSDH